MRVAIRCVVLGLLTLAPACKSSPTAARAPDGGGAPSRNREQEPDEEHGETPKPPPHGAVSGTTFWVGAWPPHKEGRPLHDGEAHPRDWMGADAADYSALADVVVTATRVGESDLANAADEEALFHEDPWIECYESRSSTLALVECTPIAVVRGSDLVVSNTTSAVLSWRLMRDGHDHKLVEVGAHQDELHVDVSELESGIYEIVDRRLSSRVGWVYRTQPNAAAADPTNGNCRYSIGLMPGRYRITAWHPYLRPFEQEVEIRAGIITRVNPVFSLASLRE